MERWVPKIGVEHQGDDLDRELAELTSQERVSE
jgi:hypothetical protein